MRSIARLVAVAAAFAKLAPKASNQNHAHLSYDSWSSAESRWAASVPPLSQEATSPQAKVLQPKSSARRPRISYDDIRKNVDPLIASRGWAVHVANRNPRSPGFAYSIGLVAKELPELIIIGPLRVDMMVDAIDTIAKQFLQTGVATGDFPNIMNQLPVRVRDVDPQAFGKYGTAATTWANRNHCVLNRTMQIVFSDRQGRFPGNAHYDWIEQILLPKPPEFSTDPPIHTAEANQEHE